MANERRKKYRDINPGEVFPLSDQHHFTVQTTKNGGKRPVKTSRICSKLFAKTTEHISDSFNFCPDGFFQIIGRIL